MFPFEFLFQNWSLHDLKHEIYGDDKTKRS